MPGIAGEAIGLFFDLARKKTTIKEIGEKLDIGALIKTVMDKAGKLNFGDLKDSLFQVISDATAPVKSVPNVKEISGIKDMYLSKTTTEELRKNLDTNKELMEKVPAPPLTRYKEESLRLIDSFSDKLKEYEKCFDILIQGKSSSFLRRKNSVDYNKIWGVRKTMKGLLQEMESLLRDYNKKGNTFEEIKKKFKEENEETHKKAKSALERLMFAVAYKSVYKEVLSRLHKPKFKSDLKSKFGFGIIENVSEALEDLKKSCEEDIGTRAIHGKNLDLIEGAHGNFVTEEVVPDFDKVKNEVGPKLCSLTAEESLSGDENKTPFEVRGLRAEPPFMGDYTSEILECVEKTQRELNDVINLGSRKSKEPPQQSGESKTFEKDIGNLDINLKTLLGDQYKNYVKNFEKQKEVLKTAVNKNLVKQMYTLHSQVEKEYKKIDQYKRKHFRDSNANDAPSEGDGFRDFSQLKVNMTSTKTGSDKDYEITSKYTELQECYNDALKNNMSANYVSFYIRKAEKFLKACKVWNKERSKYEKWLSDRKIIAKEWLKKVKKHFLYLKSNNNIENYELRRLKKEYGKFPWFAYTFVKNFKKNVQNAEEFCGIKIKDNKLVDSEGNSLNS